MALVEAVLERKLDSLTLPLALVLPGGRRLGAADAAVTLRLRELGPLAHIASGAVGKVAQDYVEGRLDFDGSVRDLVQIGAQMVGTDPTRASACVGSVPTICAAICTRSRTLPSKSSRPST